MIHSGDGGPVETDTELDLSYEEAAVSRSFVEVAVVDWASEGQGGGLREKNSS